jgi:hypothetical protein
LVFGARHVLEDARAIWLAVVLIVTGVLLDQTNWQKLIALRAVPPE